MILPMMWYNFFMRGNVWDIVWEKSIKREIKINL